MVSMVPELFNVVCEFVFGLISFAIDSVLGGFQDIIINRVTELLEPYAMTEFGKFILALIQFFDSILSAMAVITPHLMIVIFVASILNAIRGFFEEIIGWLDIR